MLAESERGAETLLEMNRQLRAELDAERAAPPGATDSDGVLRASLEDARRRLRRGATRRGERRFPTSRTRTLNTPPGVLRSSEGVRAALDEERATPSRGSTRTSPRDRRAWRARRSRRKPRPAPTPLGSRSGRRRRRRRHRRRRSRRRRARPQTSRGRSPRHPRRRRRNRRGRRGVRRGRRGAAGAATPTRRRRRRRRRRGTGGEERVCVARPLAARTGVDGDGGDAEMAAARREPTRREADLAKMRETLARRGHSENARARRVARGGDWLRGGGGTIVSSPGFVAGLLPPHAAALEPRSRGRSARGASSGSGRGADAGPAEDLEVELEILCQWKDSA